MSQGIRIPLENALKGVDWLWRLWGLADFDASVVGSVRRRKLDVGDIEIIAPLPAGADEPRLPEAHDKLFQAINRTVTNPWQDDRVGLFTAPPPAVPRMENPVATAVSGLKPGFKTLCLVVRPRPEIEVPVQIYRFTPENRGWVTLMRTGPREFGMWFLTEWKRQYGIPAAEQACRDNHLVDGRGKVVAVRNEGEAFEACGLRFVAPELREMHMKNVNRAQQEAMR